MNQFSGRHAAKQHPKGSSDGASTDGLSAYINIVHGFGPGLVEVRHKRPTGMGQQFLEPRDPELQPLIRRLGAQTDVYVGAALRKGRDGTRAGVGAVGVLWADLDGPAARERYNQTKPKASLEVMTGTGANRHVYWSMQETLTADQAEQGNRRLAHWLGADPACCDAARVLRPPGTFNHKHDPPTAVHLNEVEFEVFTFKEVVGDLPDPIRQTKQPAGGFELDLNDPLRSIPPEVYIEALTGQQVGRDSKTLCPLPDHADQDPSCHAYESGWYCFGCRRGGSIIDLGAALYGLEPRGREFHEIRRPAACRPCERSMSIKGKVPDELYSALVAERNKSSSTNSTAPPPVARDWPDVDGAELLAEIRSFVGHYMVLPSDEVADLIAVWVLHTHAIHSAYATPYLRITSATAACGKTVLMEILTTLVRCGWHAVNPSAAVLYRKIDRQRPTLLLDEMDNYPLDDRRDALAVLNAGYKRGAKIDRCKENGDLESFSAFCAKAYAGIDERRLIDTLLSRSITIRLEKRLMSDRIEPWIGQDCEELAEPLRERAAAWADQNVGHLEKRPELPEGFINRAAEVWRPLVAIGDRAGDHWPKRIRRAAEVLATGGDGNDERDERIELLSDIRGAFGANLTITTAQLCDYLNGVEDGPWAARRKDQGLDPRGLARMLRPFGIRPKQVRVGDKTLKGYHGEQFEAVFAAYLPEEKQGKQGKHPASGLERDVSDVSDVSLFQGDA